MSNQEAKQFGVSLIISTYNRPDALSVCLDSVFKQKMLPDEIIVGDDGSRSDTRKLIERMQQLSPVPLIHVWHEDKGFRLAMMRNKAVAKASGQYIIQIDGDVMLHPLFVADHIRLSRPGYYLKGGRCNIERQLTEKICREAKSHRIYPWTKGISRAENSIHSSVLSGIFAPRYRRNKEMALGCNMSFWKDDFLKVNGYDENFEGWGREDSDLFFRIRALGVMKRHMKFAGIAFHLWHEDKFMDNFEQNDIYWKQRQANCIVYCEKGVDKYL